MRLASLTKWSPLKVTILCLIVLTVILVFWMMRPVTFVSASGDSTSSTKYIESPDPQTLVFPGDSWLAAPPEAFGWSSEGLAQVKDRFEAIGGDAIMVVVNGYVIAEWGEVGLPIDNRSMRKSYLSSLYGIAVDRGEIDIEKNLRELGVDDIQPLSEAEKEAKIRHLLTTSSGVYHPAAFEPPSMSRNRPPRNSQPPGAVFFYNNWDFNTLGSIYEGETRRKLVDDIFQQIAIPLQMEDLGKDHVRYYYEKNKSKHPAFLMATSARDDARLGHLFLNSGIWGDQQILSNHWVNLSTSVQSQAGDRYFDYGYLWWVGKNSGNYFARGNSGQYICVAPDLNSVVVFRADPGTIFKRWLGARVRPAESFGLLQLIMKAAPNPAESSSNEETS